MRCVDYWITCDWRWIKSCILEISILETKKIKNLDKKRKYLLRLKRIECLASTPILLELSSELCFLLFLAKKKNSYFKIMRVILPWFSNSENCSGWHIMEYQGGVITLQRTLSPRNSTWSSGKTIIWMRMLKRSGCWQSLIKWRLVVLIFIVLTIAGKWSGEVQSWSKITEEATCPFTNMNSSQIPQIHPIHLIYMFPLICRIRLFHLIYNFRLFNLILPDSF